LLNSINIFRIYSGVQAQVKRPARKQIARLTLGFWAVLVCASAIAQNEINDGWTLTSLISYALENNKQLEARELAIKKREQSVLVAEGEDLLEVDFVSSLDAYPENERLLIERHGFRESNPFEDVILKTGLLLTYPLYTGGRIKQKVGAAEAGVKFATAQTSLSRQELILNVTSAYYSYLNLQSILEANEALLRSVMESRRVAAQQLAVGRSAKLDLLILDARVSAAKTQLTIFRNEVDRSLTTLAALLALPPESKLKIVGRLQAAEFSINNEEIRTTALLERQDLVAIRAKIMAQRHIVEIARSQLGPQLDSSVFLGGYMGDSGESQGDIKISVNLNIPLFNGNSLEAKERQTLYRLQELQARLAHFERQALAEVDRALIALNSARARLSTGQLSVELAQEALRIERQKFQQGRGTGNDLLLAEEVVLRARTEFVAAQVDSQLALAALRFATGQIERPIDGNLTGYE